MEEVPMPGPAARPPAARGRGHRPPVGEPVLDKAFRLLESFSDDEPALTLTRLSKAAGLPLSTTSRLAQSLVRLGALERGADGAYTIGLRLLERAALAPRGHGLRRTALPFMEDLHRATSQHVLLGVRDGGEVVLTERLSAPHAGKVDYRVGGRLPLHLTGIGLVLLAHAPAEFRDAYLRVPLTDDQGRPLAARMLRRRLDGVLTAGVAHLRRVLPEPAWSVAAPIRQGGEVVAALSVVAADGSLNPRGIEPAVVAIAHAVSRELSAGARREA
ncbi:IclR family transcriptional regulator [Actinacidiphila sp. DG2A-62]|uniref:IclR family transcriptional regulator n=1 Tax=Actinacidiphila sp. DG2A-62 TaxID=3108821 RepID=UPI002DBB7E02|nr:IclR family transcriptional regulator [Actinacidiphila sp. DG2A-62]MEC3993755.1 IclR family transcriptional regulator [Actinacidiphila sp. DG2A-62]